MSWDLKIKENKTIKDLGILRSKYVSFFANIDIVVLSSKIKAGLLLGTLKTREGISILTMFNSYIRNEMEYSHLIWYPEKKRGY